MRQLLQDLRSTHRRVSRKHLPHVRDIFGDHGICGVAIVKKEAPEYVLDTLLMSCRVIGRRVESFVLWHILDTLKPEGSKRLLATYVRSKRKDVIRSYLDETFDVLQRDGDERTTYNIVADRLQVAGLFQVEEAG